MFLKRITFFIKKRKRVLICILKIISLQEVNQKFRLLMFLSKYKYLTISILSLLVFPVAILHSATLVSTSSDSIRTNYINRDRVDLSDSIINYGKVFLNTPYRYGSSGTSSFDCSGFTSYVYRNFGYNLERCSIDQSRQFESIDRDQLKKGDLVFFSGRHKSKQIGHVGIVVAAKGNGEFEFIHAAVHKGVTISNSSEEYYTKRFLKASRVIAANPILKVVHKLMSFRNSREEPEVRKQAQAPVQQASAVPARQVKKVVPAEYHHVKSGETLSSIAQKYGMTVEELKRKNKIKGNKLSLKQRLKVKDEVTTVESRGGSGNNSSGLADNKTNSNRNESSRSDQDASNKQLSAGGSHIVKKGESLYTIARLYNTSVAELKKINDLPKGKLHAGQEIKVNSQTDPVANKNEVAKAEVPQKAIVGKTGTHKVVSGESLYSISKSYDIPVDELMRINNLSNRKIRVGQELKLNQSGDDSKSKRQIAERQENKADKKVNNTRPEAAEKVITHKIKKGESLATIAKNNNTTVEELERINNIPNGKIRAGQELKITQNGGEQSKNIIAERQESKAEKKANSPKSEATEKTTTHKIKKGESLITIAKNNNTTVEELERINNIPNGKIRAGQELKIAHAGGEPTKNLVAEKQEARQDSKKNNKSEESGMTVNHKVKKGESLISIAKDNNISVEELKKLNNLSDSKIRFGQELKLTQSSEKSKNSSSKTERESKSKSIQHKVKSGESYYSIAKDYGCTVDDLKDWNKNSGGKIKIGETVIVHAKSK